MTKDFRNLTLSALCILTLVVSSSGCRPPAQTAAAPTAPAAPAPSAAPTSTAVPPAPVYPEVPYELISRDSLFGYLEDLTSIQPYSGWRNSGSSGEAEALDYVAGKLGEFSNLQNWGLALERQSFKVFSSVELWDTQLHLTVQGKETEVPANGLRGSRFDPRLALSLDSDGAANDTERDPRTAAGAPLVVRETQALYALRDTDVRGRILFLDYALVDNVVNENYLSNGQMLMSVINQGLGGVVLVTQFSNQDGESHGSFVGDGSVFQWLDHVARIPVLYARLEDLGPAGVTAWEDLGRVEAARVIWDADVFIPGQSGNLVARIPGRDSSRAVILLAHIDSPNGPGALDDGSGSAILLEVARVLEVSKVQPAVDLYLAWLGGHELMTYGSCHFVSTHQELLDRTIAIMGIDGLGHGLDGKPADITMTFTSYGQYGEERAPWPEFLSQATTGHGVAPKQYVTYGTIADNTNFDAFDVPNLNLDSLTGAIWHTQNGSYFHYAMHWHDPYDTVELAREVGDLFEGMAKVALAAALETGRSPDGMRVTPRPERRALFVASHTEPDTIAPGMLRELGMALAWEGFDVDLLPYGQAITRSDLENTAIVVLLPTIDYPGPNSEAWSDAEFALLTEYVEQGGFLVVTNTGYNVAQIRHLEDVNEDATDFNALLKPMGIKFDHGNLSGGVVRLTADHPLAADAQYLTSVYAGHQVPMTQTGGIVLARGVIGLVDYGTQGGQVLAIADLGLLKDNADGAKNLSFVKNIARFARTR